MRVFAKLLLGQLDHIGISPRKIPALESVLKEINPDSFCRDENCFGVFAADDDARARKEPCRINVIPQLPGGRGIGLICALISTEPSATSAAPAIRNLRIIRPPKIGGPFKIRLGYYFFFASATNFSKRVCSAIFNSGTGFQPLISKTKHRQDACVTVYS